MRSNRIEGKPSATAGDGTDDGTDEAVGMASRRFAVGVRWHPEENPDDPRLFEALVAAGT